MSNIIEINNIEELASYRLLWRSLLAETRGASFFQSFDWLEVYWKHFGKNQQLRVLIVEGEFGPIGILPLVVREEKTKVGTVRVLTYPLHDWGTFYGPIGSNPTATLLAAFRYLQSTERTWDIMDIRWVQKDSVDYGRVQNSMRMVGATPTESQWGETALIDLNGSWDDYWANLKSHWRTNVRRSIKKLEAQGEVNYERYRPLGTAHGDDDLRWDLYDLCEDLAAESWQGSSDTGTTMSHESVRDFLRDVHKVAVRYGAVDINILRIDGKAVAFSYNYHFNGEVYGLRTGYHQRLGHDGAGSVLMWYTIKDSFARNDTTFNLGPGYLQCKRHWWTSVETIYNYTYYPSLLSKTQILRFKHWATNKLGYPQSMSTKNHAV